MCESVYPCQRALFSIYQIGFLCGYGLSSGCSSSGTDWEEEEEEKRERERERREDKRGVAIRRASSVCSTSVGSLPGSGSL